MSSLDILILIVLIIGAARGFYSGIIRQAAEILGLILSFLLAVQLMGPLGDRVAETTGWAQGVTRGVAFLLIFVAVQIGMYLLARLLERIIGVLRLTIFNRIAGAILGAFKLALFVSVAAIMLALVDVPDAQSRQGSMLYEPVARLVPETWEFVSDHLPAMKRLSDEFGREIDHLLS